MSLTRVVAADVNGSVYNTVPANLDTNVGGNGGSGTKLGSGNNLLDSVEVSRTDVGVFGSTVLDNDSADKALSAGVFAYNSDNPIAKRLTSELSTVSNDYLVSGAADPANIRSIHKLEVLRTNRITTALRDNKFDFVNGTWEGGYPVTAVDTLDDDHAALPTRSVPGELVFTSNGVTANSADYSKKNG